MCGIEGGERSTSALEFVDTLEDGLVAYDAQFRFLWMNPAAERLLGMKASELAGRSQWEAFPATLGTPLESAFRRAMAEREAVKLEQFFELWGKWCQVRVTPRPYGGLTAQFRDITDSKSAEQVLHRTALFPAQNPSPVMRVGRDGTLLFANPGAAPVLEEWQCAVESRLPDDVRQVVETALEDGVPQELEIHGGGRDISFIVSPVAGLDCANLYGRDVTERKQAEEALHRLNAELEQRAAEQTSEIRRGYEALEAERQRLQEVLDMLPVYAVLLTPDYQLRVANRFFRERFGESNGRRCYEYLFDRTEPCEVCDTFTVLKTDAPHRWEWTGPDGRNYDIHDFPFRDTDGSKLIMEVGLDITDRKRAQAELAKHRDHLAELVAERTAQLAAAHADLLAEKNRYWALFDQMTEGFALHEIVCDEQGVPRDYRFLDINPAFERLTGLKRHEVAGRTIKEVLPGEAPGWIQRGGAVALTGEPIQLEHYSRELKRHYSILAYRPAPGQFAVIFTEVTERKLAEDALRESEGRLRLVAEAAKLGTYDADPVAGTLYLSPEFRAILGYPADAPAPPRGRVPEYIHPDDAERVQQMVRQSYDPAGTGALVDEHRIVRPDGSVRWVQVRGQVHFTGEGDQRRAIRSSGIMLDITERKLAEEALRQSEERLRLAQEAAGLGAFEWNIQTGVNTWTPKLEQMYGLAPGAFARTQPGWESLIHPDDRAGALERVKEAFATGAPTEGEWRVIWPDESVHWLAGRWQIFKDAGGTPLRLTGVNLDITERKQAEERIRYHNTVLDAINRVFREALTSETEEALGRRCVAVAEELTGSEIGFIGEKNADGRLSVIAISDLGREACQMEKPAGQRKLPVSFPIHGIYGRVLLDGQGFFTNDPMSHPDRVGTPEGHPLLTAFLGVPLRHEGGTFGMIAVGNRAGGYRPRDLEALESLAAAIVPSLLHRRAKEATQRHRADLDHAQSVAQAGSWRLDVQRNELTWSRENHRIFGIPEGTRMTYETFLGAVHPDDRDLVDRAWKAGLRGEPYDVEHRIVRDGAVRWVRERAELEFDQQGELLGGFGTSQDVTERKLAEEERALQARLKDEFLALLGHELRNPLAAISTAMHLLSSGVTLERQTSLSEMVGRQVTVLQRLVDDLLDLARITHGQIELKKGSIDLAEFLQRVTATARSSIAGRRQELVVRLPSERVLFMVDGVRLEQIAANLLNNASKYTGDGGRIELSGAREGSEVVIRCKDNGRGIPWEMQERIFEPFTRLQMAGQSAETGIGIGLALVKRLVELHGGAVSVESGGPGMGSEFTVRLPLLAPPPVPHAAGAAAARRARRSLSVVMVEDSPDVAEGMAIALEQAGHKVRVFADGPSALSGIARMKPHAVLLDIGLPGMDGYELASRLKQKQNLTNALFVGISGFKRRAHEGEARDDFDHYFVKPVDPNKLLAVLESHARPKAPLPNRARRQAVSKPLRVLLVEDNAELAEVTAEMLRQEGLEVRIVFSGREALEAAAEFRPQLTLCDLHLPDMSGREVVRGLRSDPATRGTHAVILTALHESEVRSLQRRAKAIGVDQFVSKPLTGDGLQAVLEKLKQPRRRA